MTRSVGFVYASRVSGEQLHVRFQQGDVVVDLEGDASWVQAELAALRMAGYGHLLDFFGTSRSGGGEGGTTGGGLVTTPLAPLTAPMRTLAYAVTGMKVPLAATSLALDLDGDGHADNKLAAPMAALAAVGLDMIALASAAAAAASNVLLLSVMTAADDLSVDQRVDVTAYVGSKTSSSGSAFTVDATIPGVRVCGWLGDGRFVTQNPLLGGDAATLRIPLALFPAAPSFVASVRAGQLSFSISSDGSTLSDGVIAGAIDAADVASLGAGIAKQLTAWCAADPQSSAVQQVLAIFDTGGCTNPDGSLAQAGDGVIDVCEVTSNPIIRNVLAPDVGLFDAAGQYAPGGTTPKSLMSVGLGFSAVPATF
jgi:hypothetical protein